jgi:hypothetical protein
MLYQLVPILLRFRQINRIFVSKTGQYLIDRLVLRQD